MSEVIQGFQTTWSSKGDHSFTPNTIYLRNIKIDWEGQPDKFKDNYLGFLADLETDQDRAQWPYIRFVMERLIERTHHDLENKAYGKGVYSAASGGVAGAAINTMDGLVKLARTAVNNGGHEMDLSNDPFVEAQAFDAFEEIMGDFPEEIEGEKIKIFCDPVAVRNYLRDKRNTLGTNIDQKASNVLDFSDLYMDGSGFGLVPLACLRGTNAIIATPEGNLFHARRSGNIPAPKVESGKRTVSIFTDWWEGFGFGVNDLVYFYNAGWSYSGSAPGSVV